MPLITVIITRIASYHNSELPSTTQYLIGNDIWFSRVGSPIERANKAIYQHDSFMLVLFIVCRFERSDVMTAGTILIRSYSITRFRQLRYMVPYPVSLGGLAV